MRDYGIDLSSKEIGNARQVFDKNHDGYTSFNEILLILLGDVNSRRLKFVHLAFQQADRTRDGIVSVDDLVGIYGVSTHPKYRSGNKSTNQILSEFIDQ